MIIGIGAGIVGIIFACKLEWLIIFLCCDRKKNEWNICEFAAQVDGFMNQSNNSTVTARNVSFD